MSKPHSEKPEKHQEAPIWIKYLGLSFQLLALIGGSTALGWWLHQQSAMMFPLWLLLGLAIGMMSAGYILWKSTQEDR
ncbi:MAG: AtpZ/AtpI family protein [Algoriphagus sp.]|nr:AtpZ/AtpI family protein [Bacteroidota bacterium]